MKPPKARSGASRRLAKAKLRDYATVAFSPVGRADVIKKAEKHYIENTNRDVAQLVARVLWEHDVKGSVASRGVRKQLIVVFPERDRALRRESNPVIPTLPFKKI